ncbi:hypothetical protein MMC25_008151 [Agyrium rufum]|nr:hypothetical protein [Agyrium rufum]
MMLDDLLTAYEVDLRTELSKQAHFHLTRFNDFKDEITAFVHRAPQVHLGSPTKEGIGAQPTSSVDSERPETVTPTPTRVPQDYSKILEENDRLRNANAELQKKLKRLRVEHRKWNAISPAHQVAEQRANLGDCLVPSGRHSQSVADAVDSTLPETNEDAGSKIGLLDAELTSKPNFGAGRSHKVSQTKDFDQNGGPDAEGYLDRPKIVSSRFLKRKRLQTRFPPDLDYAVNLDGKRSRSSPLVKIELSSDNSRFPASSGNLGDDGLDLDEFATHMNTPKKSHFEDVDEFNEIRQGRHESRRTTQTHHASCPRQKRHSAPPDIDKSQGVCIFQKKMRGVPDEDRVDVPSIPSINYKLSYGQDSNHPAIKLEGTFGNHKEEQDTDPRPEKDCPKLASNLDDSTERSVLAPKDPNMITGSRDLLERDPRSIDKPQRIMVIGPPISAIAEDGECMNKAHKISRASVDQQADLQKPRQWLPRDGASRLEDLLLNRDSTSREVLTPKTVCQRQYPVTLPNKPRRSGSVILDLNERQVATKSSRSFKVQQSTVIPFTPERGEVVSPDLSKIAPQAAKVGIRLRESPLHALRLEDFKINPNTNQGIDFAFKEPKRSADSRRYPAFCTKPDCCGDTFQRLVEIEAPVPYTTGRWSSSPPTESQMNDAVIMDHSGWDCAQLTNIHPDVKQELLLKAMAARCSANFGKHGLTGYERAASPPGFWRTDMPTTQEALADQEEAEKLKRKRVEERWREAIVSDGRGLWKFRDE